MNERSISFNLLIINKNNFQCTIAFYSIHREISLRNFFGENAEY